ncbi:hypothetical protein BKX93_10780 [Chromobacterium vaccinii]|uniref:Uncharacterized protein n=1 Tax=Chromobacterium vaccinii TaxID=1108595 RepID=A0A1D9LGN3_9NEIS|nr:hypothetical protein BKX93_10780 [Chromobacterium vaccinii]
MAILWVVVVPWAIKIRRHYAAIVTIILPIITLAQFYPCYLCDSIGLICGFKQACEERLFINRLICKFGINAAGA